MPGGDTGQEEAGQGEMCSMGLQEGLVAMEAKMGYSAHSSEGLGKTGLDTCPEP